MKEVCLKQEGLVVEKNIIHNNGENCNQHCLIKDRYSMFNNDIINGHDLMKDKYFEYSIYLISKYNCELQLKNFSD